MTAQDRMDRALGGDAKVAVEPANQQLANLAGAPMRLLLLERTIRLSICPGNWLA